MVSPGEQEVAQCSSPGDDVYFSARSRTASLESVSSRERRNVALAPLSGDGRSISVSSSVNRRFKDRRIYVNQRTGLPVRPPTSFGLFKHALRRSMAGNKVSFSDFNKRAIEQWAKMRDHDKELYAQRARELADQYKRIEVRFLRKKVRQMLRQNKEARREQGAPSSSLRPAPSATAMATAASSSSSSSSRGQQQQRRPRAGRRCAPA